MVIRFACRLGVYECSSQNTSNAICICDVSCRYHCMDALLFCRCKTPNYNTKPVKEQLGQIVEVMKRHMILFPGILLQGASISALLPILPTYATKVVG